MATARYHTPDHSVICLEDESGTRFVPVDPGNADYAELVLTEMPIADYQAPPATPDMVRAEARRRILAAFPEWKQANMTARATELVSIELREGSLTAGQEAERDAIETAWTWIKSVREASNVLELDPPANYADAVHWPEAFGG